MARRHLVIRDAAGKPATTGDVPCSPRGRGPVKPGRGGMFACMSAPSSGISRCRARIARRPRRFPGERQCPDRREGLPVTDSVFRGCTAPGPGYGRSGSAVEQPVAVSGQPASVNGWHEDPKWPGRCSPCHAGRSKRLAGACRQRAPALGGASRPGRSSWMASPGSARHRWPRPGWPRITKVRTQTNTSTVSTSHSPASVSPAVASPAPGSPVRWICRCA